MKKNISTLRGFTLIELLVVIAIIALLTGIVLTSLSPAKSKGRDTKRISDIGQMQLSLELYFDRCKAYPTATDDNRIDIDANNAYSGTCAVNFGQFMSVIPTPPSGDTWGYVYKPTDDDFTLSTKLENYNEILKDDLDIDACGETDNTSAERVYCLGPK